MQQMHVGREENEQKEKQGREVKGYHNLTQFSSLNLQFKKYHLFVMKKGFDHVVVTSVFYFSSLNI